jgi:hypothetical protein
MNTPFDVRIGKNLVDTLLERGFEKESALSLKYLENTKATVWSTWTDDDGQEYYTVDLCVEIPVECCKVMC